MFGGIGSTWGDNFYSYGHAEWIEIRDLMTDFDSHLRIKVMAL